MVGNHQCIDNITLWSSSIQFLLWRSSKTFCCFLCDLIIPFWKLVQSSLCPQCYDISQKYSLLWVCFHLFWWAPETHVFLFCKIFKKLFVDFFLHLLHPLFLEFIILMLLLFYSFPSFLKFYLLSSISLSFHSL